MPDTAVATRASGCWPPRKSCSRRAASTRCRCATSPRRPTPTPPSINYHFGSKRGLIDAIVERRADALGRRRAELLDELEGAGPVDLRAVIRAMVLPTAELVHDDPTGALRVVPRRARRSSRAHARARRVRAVDRALPRRARTRDAGAAASGAGAAVRGRAERDQPRARADVGRPRVGRPPRRRGRRCGGERDRHARRDLHRAGVGGAPHVDPPISASSWSNSVALSCRTLRSSSSSSRSANDRTVSIVCGQVESWCG